MAVSLWQIQDEYGVTSEEALLEERRWALLSAEGDARAFRSIVERHHRGVHQFILRIVGSEADTEELAQETFARAFVHMERFDPKYRLSTWLYRIVFNLCVNETQRSRATSQRPSGARRALHQGDHQRSCSAPFGSCGPRGDRAPTGWISRYRSSSGTRRRARRDGAGGAGA